MMSHIEVMTITLLMSQILVLSAWIVYVVIRGQFEN